MNDMTCSRCQSLVPVQHIDFVHDEALCRACIIAEASDPAAIAHGERELLRSTGRRRLAVGVVMLAVGVAILSLGLTGDSLILVPTGMLFGGLFEIVQGVRLTA